MSTEGIARIKKLYPIWFLIWLAFLYLVFQYNLQDYLLWLVIILTLKDIFIDPIYERSIPYSLEHGPLVILISVIGLLEIFGVIPPRGLVSPVLIGIISPLTTGIAIVDSFIDFTQDVYYNKKTGNKKEKQ